MLVLKNPLDINQTESQSEYSFGVGFFDNNNNFSDPTKIYLPGHRTYTEIDYGSINSSRISGITKNINLLGLKDDTLFNSNTNIENIFLLQPNLENTFNIEKGFNGLSILNNTKNDLKNKIIFNDNILKNF